MMASPGLSLCEQAISTNEEIFTAHMTYPNSYPRNSSCGIKALHLPAAPIRRWAILVLD